MALSSVFWRPVNLLRSQDVRSGSKHTSVWGLGRLFSKTRDMDHKDAIAQNLSSRMLLGKVKVASLYQLEPALVARAIELTDLAAVSSVLSKATKKMFPYTFVAEGKIIIKDIYDGSRTREEVYSDQLTKPYYHFNLSFFKGLKEATKTDVWESLVAIIAASNASLHATLVNLEEEIGRADTSLRLDYKLPVVYKERDLDAELAAQLDLLRKERQTISEQAMSPKPVDPLPTDLLVAKLMEKDRRLQVRTVLPWRDEIGRGANLFKLLISAVREETAGVNISPPFPYQLSGDRVGYMEFSERISGIEIANNEVSFSLRRKDNDFILSMAGISDVFLLRNNEVFVAGEDIESGFLPSFAFLLCRKGEKFWLATDIPLEITVS